MNDWTPKKFLLAAAYLCTWLQKTMSGLFYFQFLLLLITLIFYFYRSKKRGPLNEGCQKSPLKLLPGPFCVPGIGYLPFFFAKNKHKFLADLAKIYGDVYQIQIGSKIIVVINSMPIFREAMNNWSFAGRPEVQSFKAFSMGEKFHRFSLMTLNPEWKFMRKHSIKALGLFATSKNSRLQAVVEEACQNFHLDIEANLGQPFNPKPSVFECAAGIMGAINFGLQFDRKDPILQKLVELTHTVTLFFKVGNILDYFSFGQRLMKYKVKQFHEMMSPMDAIIENHIVGHKCNEMVTDLADALYQMRLNISDEEFQILGIDPCQIQNLAQDLFLAGYVTTMESFMWSLNLLAKFPDVQNKMGQELIREIGQGKFPNLDDRVNNTPYTEATLLEVFRVSSLAPLYVPHAAVQSDQLAGYHVPEGAIILPNMWAMSHDSQVFKNPMEFDPSRFLRNDGSLNVDYAQNVTPFGLGKRRCVGENLARQELYLLLAATMLKYSVEPAPGESIDTDENVIEGIVRVIPPCKLIFRIRK